MSAAPVLEAHPGRSLPRDISGPRATTWWGMLLFIAIETTVLGSLYTAYFYLRVKAVAWPPDGVEPPPLLTASLGSGALVASAVPAFLGRIAFRQDRARLGTGLLVIGGAGVAAYLILTALDLLSLGYSWESHAYGSLVWTLNGYSMLHAAALVVLAGFTVPRAARRGRAGDFRGVEVTVLYWIFAAIAAVPTFVTLYVVPHVG